MQFDAASGKIGGSSLSGLGGHIFWRDSDKGLIGITATNAKLGGIDVNRTGLEGELYLNQWTVSGGLGDLGGDLKGSYADVNARYYYSGNMMIETGLSKADNEDRFHLGIEATPFAGALQGLSLFADFASGNNGYDHALIGIKYYFGKKKDLIKRHREDDPINPVFGSLAANIRAVAERKAAERKTAESQSQVAGGGGGPIFVPGG